MKVLFWRVGLADKKGSAEGGGSFRALALKTGGQTQLEVVQMSNLF